MVERDVSGDFSANIITASNVVSTVNGIDISALNTTLSGLDSAAVKKTGDQTIAGVKTFSDNVALNGGLTIAGGTTAINSTVLTVQDINVELGVGAANDAAVDGGGIILKGGDDKKITWDDSN